MAGSMRFIQPIGAALARSFSLDAKGVSGGPGFLLRLIDSFYCLLPFKISSLVAAWMGGVSRGERIHVYVWLSPFDVHLKLSQRC